MKLNATASIEDGRLKIDTPISLPSGKIQVEIIIRAETSASKKHRDLSGLVGKLSYKGDAMNLQREMRDDWPE